MMTYGRDYPCIIQCKNELNDYRVWHGKRAIYTRYDEKRHIHICTTDKATRNRAILLAFLNNVD